jgi:hypothetical protein
MSQDARPDFRDAFEGVADPGDGRARGEDWQRRAGTSSDEGSRFAEWFNATGVQMHDCEEWVSVPPLDRLSAVIVEAQMRATVWRRFAADLKIRAHDEARSTVSQPSSR